MYPTTYREYDPGSNTNSWHFNISNARDDPSYHNSPDPPPIPSTSQLPLPSSQFPSYLTPHINRRPRLAFPLSSSRYIDQLGDPNSTTGPTTTTTTRSIYPVIATTSHHSSNVPAFVRSQLQPRDPGSHFLTFRPLPSRQPKSTPPLSVLPERDRRRVTTPELVEEEEEKQLVTSLELDSGAVVGYDLLDDEVISEASTTPPPEEDHDDASGSEARTIEEFNLGKAKPFIKILYSLLSDPDEYRDCIKWNKQGTSFVIAQNDRFVNDVLLRHFQHNNLTSFTRQLNVYEFTRMTSSQLSSTLSSSLNTADYSGWSHPLFLREEPSLLLTMKPRPSNARIRKLREKEAQAERERKRIYK